MRCRLSMNWNPTWIIRRKRTSVRRSRRRLSRYCSRLNINDELTKLCQFIAVMIEKQNLIPENTPHSIASGIIYFVADMCNLSITKKDVNRVSDMSEVTINKCYKKLYDMRDKLIPKMIISKYQK